MDYSLYVEVSRAVFTGQEYFVEFSVFTHYNDLHWYEDSFGYQFTFDADLQLVHWETVYF